MATDKRLDQVSTLTDFDYALIVKGDQVAKVTSAQLASVMAGLMNTNKLFAYMYRNASDLNKAEDGWTAIAVETLNRPETTDTGVIGFCSTTTYYSNTYRAQICCMFTGEVYVRSTYDGNNNNWLPWRRIDNFGYNTLKELASAVAGNHGMKITCKHNVQTSSLTETDLGSITNGIVILIPSAFQSAASIVTVNGSSVDYIKKHDGTTFRCADGSLYASFTSGVGVCKYIKIQFDYEL